MDANSEKRVIRIVDDDPRICRALIRLVESMELDAHSYTSPEELLGVAFGDETGCLLLDVQLPGMDGFELYRRISAQGLGIPVVFISSHVGERARRAAADAGAIAFLEKPFDDERLFAAIRQALDSHAGPEA